jgi:hypothetical protein
MSTNGVGYSCAKRASDQRARGSADRVINQMVNGREGECSGAGHSTLRAQQALLRWGAPWARCVPPGLPATAARITSTSPDKGDQWGYGSCEMECDRERCSR